MPSSAHDTETAILQGMARALWVHAFMIWSTEVEPPPMMAGTWEEATPDSASHRKVSMQAARELAELVTKANGVRSMTEFMDRYTSADPALVGAQVAQVCLGVMDLDDTVLRPGIRVRRAGAPAGRARSTTSHLAGSPRFPHFKVELSDDADELSWEGAADEPGMGRAFYHHNPDEGPLVLLIEDEPRLQAGTTRMIKKIYPGARVIVADNGAAALGDIGCHDFALVVSDVDILGNLSGIDVFHKVKADHPELVDKWVFFTGNSAAESEHYRYLPKGAVSAADLQAVIDQPAPRGARRATKPPASRALSDQDLAAEVHAALRRVGPDGRFGSRKVFISALWNAMPGGMSLEQFKRRLVDLNRASLIELARADLVAAMDPELVQMSETSSLGSTYHFVVDRGAKEAWER